MNMWSLTCESNERDSTGGKLSAATMSSHTIGTTAYHEISINSSDTGYASVEKKTTGSQITTDKSLNAIKKPTIDHSSFDSFESCCFSSDLDRIKIENSSSSSGGNSLSITFKRTSSSSSSSSTTNQNEEEQPTAIDKRIDFYDDDHKNNNTTLSTSDEELSDLRATASSSIDDDECIKLTG